MGILPMIFPTGPAKGGMPLRQGDGSVALGLTGKKPTSVYPTEIEADPRVRPHLSAAEAGTVQCAKRARNAGILPAVSGASCPRRGRDALGTAAGTAALPPATLRTET